MCVCVMYDGCVYGCTCGCVGVISGCVCMDVHVV